MERVMSRSQLTTGVHLRWVRCDGVNKCRRELGHGNHPQLPSRTSSFFPVLCGFPFSCRFPSLARSILLSSPISLSLWSSTLLEDLGWVPKGCFYPRLPRQDRERKSPHWVSLQVHRRFPWLNSLPPCSEQLVLTSRKETPGTDRVLCIDKTMCGVYKMMHVWYVVEPSCRLVKYKELMVFEIDGNHNPTISNTLAI